MATIARIDMNPDIMMGKPVIRGTRISVELILRKLAEGAATADVCLMYPQLTEKDVRLAVEYSECAAYRGNNHRD